MVDDPTPVAGKTPLLDVNATTQPGKDDEEGTRVVSATRSPDAPTLVPAGAAAAAMFSLPPPGYELGNAIGRGGMGEVVVAKDLRIGREVAVKRMTAEKPSNEQTVRFLREARIQARLDHPAIVPVHELGVDDKGRLFFTMKRLGAGKTLANQLAGKMPQNRALRVLVDVCLAVEFAHQRGVVHRDLKPSNIMLGDFGEVYVIDWGIARVLAEDSIEVGEATRISTSDIATLDDGTKTGALLGTPGYMSPEQLRGQRATTAADIYALGAILFEVLAGESLHKRGEAGIGTTLSDPQVHPSTRKPERNIAPELDALCFAALDEDPTKRPTAREVADKLQSFLDGDRDLARRRELASEQITAAKEAMASKSADARALAMRHAGYALSLDPQSEEAGHLVSALLLEPPPQLPAELEKSLDTYERKLSSERSRLAMWTYASLFLLLPFVAVVQIKEWGLLLGIYGVVLVAMLAAVRYRSTGRPNPVVALTVNLLLIVLFSRIAGPFILTPLIAAGGLIVFTSMRGVIERTWVIWVWAASTVLLPIGVEYMHLFPWTWQIEDGFMIVQSNIVQSAGAPTEAALITGSIVLHIALGWFMLALARQRRLAQTQLFIQAWHLRQLLPR
ncbi:MAG: serine/threonine-protein kinase [Kofleriaceae bacterium]